MTTEEIVKRLISIQKSTRTFFKDFLPLHNYLRIKNKLYYDWHLSPWASRIHFLSILFYFFTAFTFVLMAAFPPLPRAYAATTTLQPGAEGKDAYVISMLPANQGAATFLEAGGDTGTPPPARAYLEFNLSSIPADSTINSAVLQLYYYSLYGPLDASQTLSLYKVTSSWDEMTIVFTSQPSFSGSATTSTSIGSSSAYGWYSFNITSLVSEWISDS